MTGLVSPDPTTHLAPPRKAGLACPAGWTDRTCLLSKLRRLPCTNNHPTRSFTPPITNPFCSSGNDLRPGCSFSLHAHITTNVSELVPGSAHSLCKHSDLDVSLHSPRTCHSSSLPHILCTGPTILPFRGQRITEYLRNKDELKQASVDLLYVVGETDHQFNNPTNRKLQTSMWKSTEYSHRQQQRSGPTCQGRLYPRK